MCTWVKQKGLCTKYQPAAFLAYDFGVCFKSAGTRPTSFGLNFRAAAEAWQAIHLLRRHALDVHLQNHV